MPTPHRHHALTDDQPCPGLAPVASTRRRPAFTLVELLVVVAILALLIALLLPAMERARFVVRLATCSSNLRQISIGVTAYASSYASWYPTDGDLMNRGRTFQFPTKDVTWNGIVHQETAYKELSTYYGWSTPSVNGLTYRNKLWQCPQGVLEAEKSTYYSLFSDTYAGISFASYVGPFPAPRSVDHPERMLRRIEDNWVMGETWRRPSGYPANPQYNILASDACHRVGHSGGGMATNHMWKGTRLSPFSYTALQTRSLDAEATANFALTDGSVQPYGPFYWPAMGVPLEMNIGGLGGIGCDPYCVPAAWGR